MLKSIQKRKNRVAAQRKKRVRAKIHGTEQMPRVSVFRSNKHFYAQAINDDTSTTIAHADGNKLGLGVNAEDVKKVAEDLAGKLKTANVEKVLFDRNGYLYHGVVAAFADALRESGIKL